MALSSHFPRLAVRTGLTGVAPAHVSTVVHHTGPPAELEPGVLAVSQVLLHQVLQLREASHLLLQLPGVASLPP